MFCIYCGIGNPDVAEYCRACGKAIAIEGRCSTPNISATEPPTAVTTPDTSELKNQTVTTPSAIYHSAYGLYGLYLLWLFATALLQKSYLVIGYLVPAIAGIQGSLMVATAISALRRSKQLTNLSRASAALYCITHLFRGDAFSGVALLILICHYAFTGEQAFPTFRRKTKPAQ